MYSRKHDFFVAPLNQCPHFAEDQVGIETSAATADRRNDAERAIRISSILNFHDRARAAGSAEMCFGFEFVLEKDVAAENFCSAIRLCGLELQVEHLERELPHHRFVGVADNVTDLRKRCHFVGRALRVATRHDDSCEIGRASCRERVCQYV